MKSMRSCEDRRGREGFREGGEGGTERERDREKILRGRDMKAVLDTFPVVILKSNGEVEYETLEK